MLPSSIPTLDPSQTPSTSPSSVPSSGPSGVPSVVPSKEPSSAPSDTPSTSPTKMPSEEPSGEPSVSPSDRPSTFPSAEPSQSPSVAPSKSPSSVPSDTPSSEPTEQPSPAPSTDPSALPSSQPSSQPTDYPSSQPSAVPSVSPSALPTMAPSVVPSSTPSKTPSAAPSSQPTEQPSQYPSPAPSMTPSLLPSSAPSDMPSGSPSFQPSSIPTEKCPLQADGSFGTITGSSEEVLVDYDYEVETTATEQSNLVPAVERAINNALLPLLFSDLCSDDENTRRMLLEEGIRLDGQSGIRRLQTEIVALSPNPLDSIQTGDICLNEGSIGPGNSCSVIRGRLSLYGVFPTQDSIARSRAEVISAIRLGMEDDAFVSVHPSIVRLFFVERNTTIPQIESPNQVRSVEIRADSDGPFPWVVAASVASLVIFGTVVGWRKLRRNKENADDGDSAEKDSTSQEIAAHDDASMISSESDVTEHPDGISAVYGIRDADGYNRAYRRLAVYGIGDADGYHRHFSVHSDASESVSTSSSTAISSEGTNHADERQHTLGISSRDLYTSESIMEANSILFSKSTRDYSDDGDDGWRREQNGTGSRLRLEAESGDTTV